MKFRIEWIVGALVVFAGLAAFRQGAGAKKLLVPDAGFRLASTRPLDSVSGRFFSGREVSMPVTRGTT